MSLRAGPVSEHLVYGLDAVELAVGVLVDAADPELAHPHRVPLLIDRLCQDGIHDPPARVSIKSG